MRSWLTSGLVLAVACSYPLAPPTQAQAPTVEAPIYKSWARHKVGTTITIRETTDTGGPKIVSSTTSKLVKLLPDRLIIEQVVTTNASGEEQTYDPVEFDIKRTFPGNPAPRKKADPKPGAEPTEGEETITILGREYKARWSDTKGNTEAGPSYTRTWISDEFPGMVVKAVTRVPKVNKVTNVEVIEFKTP
jgi:hypothetical protein